MAGGPSNPALAAAVSTAGGLGFLAAGYASLSTVRAEIDDLTSRLPSGTPFGVNVFAPSGGPAGTDLEAYARRLAPEALAAGVCLGAAQWDDDHYRDKLALLVDAQVPVVSFTFGCPEAAGVDDLHRAGTSVWVTVTTVDEALAAVAAGADAVVAQGVEAGGHRGSFTSEAPGDIGLLVLLQLLADRLPSSVSLVATGGIADGRGVAAVLAAGAVAAQLGTAFLLCPEAGTAAVHREAISRASSATALTRAFTGRLARGIENRFLREHGAAAPTAYPQVHHLTAPLRAAARARGDSEALHLWAGQAYPLADAIPAGELVEQLTSAAHVAALDAAARTGV
ncbi:MAG: nitronate monooxygenase [Mycobacteriales bacterium]